MNVIFQKLIATNTTLKKGKFITLTQDTKSVKNRTVPMGSVVTITAIKDKKFVASSIDGQKLILTKGVGYKD